MKSTLAALALSGSLFIGVPAAFGSHSAPALQLMSENGAGQHGANRATAPLELMTEHSAGQHVGQGHPVAAPVLVVAPTDTRGFSWRDAGVGAAVALAVILTLASVVMMQRRSRPDVT
jgi:hypothetical protein